jgi:hypothetical protein
MLDGAGLEWTVGEQIFLRDYLSPALFLTSALCYKTPQPKLIIVRCYFVNTKPDPIVI